MKRWFEEILLKGQLVSLEPLNLSHIEGMKDALKDGKLWELWFTSTPTLDKVEDYIQIALEQKKEGTAFPFAVIENTSRKFIGTTRFMNASLKNKRLEIGTTWYAKSFQRTGVNTECKYLLLSYAFEELDCVAVEFRTHFQNSKSREAIARLGAKQDGILRNHTIDDDGFVRDTVVFSILNSEWKTVKRGLEFKLNSGK